MSVEHQTDKPTHTANPTPLGQEFINVLDKWRTQFGRTQVPIKVVDHMWEIARRKINKNQELTSSKASE